MIFYLTSLYRNFQLYTRFKTGALFSAAVQIGAIQSEFSQSDRELLIEFGTLIGHLYQIIDDYLDAFQSNESLQRVESSDKRNSRLTYFTDENELQGKKVLVSIYDKIKKTSEILERKKSIEPGLNNTATFY